MNLLELERLVGTIAQTDFEEPHPRKSYVPLVEAIHGLQSAGPAILSYAITATSKAKAAAGLGDIVEAMLESVLVCLAKQDPGPLLDAFLREGYGVVEPSILAGLGEAAVPKLIEGLASPNQQTVENCAVALMHIGPAAKAAVPALMRAAWQNVDDEKDGFRWENGVPYWATRAIRQIDPGQALEIIERSCADG